MLRTYSDICRTLSDGVVQLGLEPNQSKELKLVQYLELLDKWNSTFNLSGIRDIGEMLPLHVLDSLALAPFLSSASRLADVGSGAGLPGIPLAIWFPEKHFILVDSNSKKTRFIFQCCTVLKLPNVEVVHGRVESYATEAQVDIVTSRAFAALRDFVESSRHLLQPDGRFLAMKGQLPTAEVDDLPSDITVSKCSSIHVPGIKASRHVLELRIRAADAPTCATETDKAQ